MKSPIAKPAPAVSMPEPTPAQVALLREAEALRERAHGLAVQAGRLQRGNDPLRIWACWLAAALRDAEGLLKLQKATGGELAIRWPEYPSSEVPVLAYRPKMAEVIDFAEARQRRAAR